MTPRPWLAELAQTAQELAAESLPRPAAVAGWAVAGLLAHRMAP